VPKELPNNEKVAFLKSIEKKFARWDNVEIKMQEISVKLLKSRATEENRRLREAEKTIPPGIVHEQVRPTLESENNKLPNAHKHWLRSWKTNRIYQIARVFPIVAGLGSATLLISKVGLQSPMAVAVAATVGLIEFGSQYTTNRWHVDFNNWKEQVTLPLAGRIKWIRWFNERHFFKAALFNFTVFSTTKPAVYRYFMNVGNPNLAGLSAEFFGQIAAAGAGTAIFGALGHVGFRELVKSGYIGPNIRKYMVWGLAIQGIIGAGLITAGATHFVPYLLAFNWGVNGLAFLSGKILPSRAKRASVYHGELAAYGIDTELKKHNEESKPLNRQTQIKKKAKGVIEIEGKSMQEIVDAVETERARQPITKELIDKVKSTINRVLPGSGGQPNCNEMMMRSPPYF
jgi:hypothetical protein